MHFFLVSMRFARLGLDRRRIIVHISEFFFSIFRLWCCAVYHVRTHCGGTVESVRVKSAGWKALTRNKSYQSLRVTPWSTTVPDVWSLGRTVSLFCNCDPPQLFPAFSFSRHLNSTFAGVLVFYRAPKINLLDSRYGQMYNVVSRKR